MGGDHDSCACLGSMPWLLEPKHKAPNLPKPNTILRVLGPSWESAQRTASKLRIPTNKSCTRTCSTNLGLGGKARKSRNTLGNVLKAPCLLCTMLLMPLHVEQRRKETIQTTDQGGKFDAGFEQHTHVFKWI